MCDIWYPPLSRAQVTLLDNGSGLLGLVKSLRQSKCISWAIYTHYVWYGTLWYGTISKIWDIILCPFVCMCVCVFMMGRYQKSDGVPYQKYCVYCVSFLTMTTLILNKPSHLSVFWSLCTFLLSQSVSTMHSVCLVRDGRTGGFLLPIQILWLCAHARVQLSECGLWIILAITN